MEPSSSSTPDKTSADLSANLSESYANFANDVQQLKLVVVGDAYTGKTSLLYSYTVQRFVTEYNSTVFDNFALNLNIENKRYLVNIFDTSGADEYAHLRTLSYPQTNVFLLCFSLVDPKTLESCQTKWLPEIRKYTASLVPVFLVGTKEDLWEKTSESQRISLDRAQKLAEELGCVSFIPCSALTQRGLKQMFDEALLAGAGRQLKKDTPSSSCCFLL